MAYAPQPATLAAYQTFRATKVDDVHATFGATIGTNLFLPNGKVATLADLTGNGSGNVSFNGTSDEIQEGIYNLYFTDQRAQDAVGGILVDTSSIDFTYDHTTHSITADLKTTGIAAGTYGSNSSFPVITFNAQGRATAVVVKTLVAGTGTTLTPVGDTLVIASTGGGGGGEILVADGISGPPVMLTNEAEDDFIYQG